MNTRDPYTDGRQTNTFLFDGRKHSKTPYTDSLRKGGPPFPRKTLKGKKLLEKFTEEEREIIRRNTIEERHERNELLNSKIQTE